MKRLNLTVLFILFISCACYTQQSGDYGSSLTVAEKGISVGSVLAMIISWDKHKSILYALLHGLFGWLYVIYFAINRSNEED